jgi:hypothetical protein
MPPVENQHPKIWKNPCGVGLQTSEVLDGDDPAAFGKFFKDQIVLLLGIFGSIPILTDYLGPVKVDDGTSHIYTLAASFLALVGFILFYLVRDQLAKWNRFIIVILSCALIGVGGVAMVEWALHKDTAIARIGYVVGYPLILQALALPLLVELPRIFRTRIERDVVVVS